MTTTDSTQDEMLQQITSLFQLFGNNVGKVKDNSSESFFDMAKNIMGESVSVLGGDANKKEEQQQQITTSKCSDKIDHNKVDAEITKIKDFMTDTFENANGLTEMVDVVKNLAYQLVEEPMAKREEHKDISQISLQELHDECARLRKENMELKNQIAQHNSELMP